MNSTQNSTSTAKTNKVNFFKDLGELLAVLLFFNFISNFSIWSVSPPSLSLEARTWFFLLFLNLFISYILNIGNYNVKHYIIFFHFLVRRKKQFFSREKTHDLHIKLNWRRRWLIYKIYLWKSVSYLY